MDTVTPTRLPENPLAVVPGFRGHPLHVLQVIPAEGWWVLRSHGGLEPSDGRFTSRWKVPSFAVAFSEESDELVLVPFRLEDACAVLDVNPIYADESMTRLEHEDDMQWCTCHPIEAPMSPWDRWCPSCAGQRRSETKTSGIEDRLDDIAAAMGSHGGGGDVRVTCVGPPASPPALDRLVQILPVEDGPTIRYGHDGETPVVGWAVFESSRTAPVVELDHRPVVLRSDDDRYEVVR